MKSIELRLATPDQLAAILSIARAWPTHFVPAGLEAIAADFERASAIVAKTDEGVSGFLIWSADAESIEILWMAVDPRYSRKGIGRSLVDAVVAQSPGASAMIVKTATLDSRLAGTQLDGTDFEGTHRFFQAMGFTPMEVAQAHWSPHNHALILRRSLD